MGLCVSTVITADNAQSVPLRGETAEVKSVQEIVQQQPKRTKNFDADDNPLPTAGCCAFCLEPNCCNLCCCDCGDCADCACCYWCLNCECCLECDECCAQCLANCV